MSEISENFDSSQYKEILQKIVPNLTDEQFAKLSQFVEIFAEKNKHINLSAIREESLIWSKHIYDSLASYLFIAKQNPKTILDMGTGGGFPTIPLAILFPEIHFYPLDSVAKKLKCVEEFSDQLGLKNIHILNGRAEALAHEKQHREKYEMIVTRAFANFSPMLEMTMGFLKEKYYLVAYRGPEHKLDDDDLVLDYFGGFAENVDLYTLPTEEKREIWHIKKVEPMMPQFPRHIGIPKKEPISGNDV